MGDSKNFSMVARGEMCLRLCVEMKRCYEKLIMVKSFVGKKHNDYS